jgi:glycine oxidase
LTRGPDALDASAVATPDVVVIGGGVMGCAIALRLAERGLKPTVLERSVPGAEASSVAAGILAPLVEHGRPDVATRIGVTSREMHAALAQKLREEVAIDVGFRRCGAMHVALDDGDAAELPDRARAIEAAGGKVEVLADREARKREPGLSLDVRLALDLPEEAQVETGLFVRALAIAAQKAGATFRTGSTVRGLRVEGDRARGVMLDGGPLDAAHVVVAAGAWTSQVPGLEAWRIRPIRGQLLTADVRPPIARRILHGRAAYVVPRPDGRVVCGATMEDAGFEKEITLGGIGGIIASALRLAPGLARATLLSHAVNFRPESPDGLPLVGPAGPAGLWLATGHHRNGILLAPITAELVADAIAGRASGVADAAALDPRRLLPKASTDHPAPPDGAPPAAP